jgi:hypothetical protein
MTTSTEEDLRRVMRRVYTHYANRVGSSDPYEPRVALSAEEKNLLSGTDWFRVLGIPKVRYTVSAHTELDYRPGDEPALAIVVSRTQSGQKLRIPAKLGPLRLAGVLWNRAAGATVAAETPFAIQKDVLTPVKNLTKHLADNDTKSKLVLYTQKPSGVSPFAVDNYQGVGNLHLAMQLDGLRQWLWPGPACSGPDCAYVARSKPTWPEAPNPQLTQWLQTDPLASFLWAGKHPLRGAEPLTEAFEAVRSQDDLEDLVRVYDDRRDSLPAREAEVLKRATEIELNRRETKDLIAEWSLVLERPQTPVERYRALLLCAEQVRHAFIDWDWELDAPAREFLHRVEMELNASEFMPFWGEVSLAPVDDGELANSLQRALHVVNVQRESQGEEPLKLRSPLPHDVLKTWVALQRTYGPADDFAPREEYGLLLDASQRALRQLVWQKFEQLEEMAEQCEGYPQARHECERLGLAIDVLRKFKASQGSAQAKQTLLDEVRQSPQLRPLLDDILQAVA